MPLLSALPSRYSFTYDNFGSNPSATPGTSVIPGATNAEGSWTQIASGANIASDVGAIYLRVANGATSTVQKDHLLDLGMDETGGTSYTAIISDIVCGSSADITAPGSGYHFLFPIRIPAGASVAVRIQGLAGTAGTVFVSAKFYGKASSPEIIRAGAYSETVGAITNSQGVSFTPGNAADGTWTLLAATVKDLWWWNIAYQVSNTVITAERTFIDIAHGDGTNKHQIMRIMHSGGTAETCGNSIPGNINPFAAYCPVLAGTNIYIRGRCENAPDTGYNGVAVGIGG